MNSTVSFNSARRGLYPRCSLSVRAGSRNLGFTLIEVMVVVVILGVLAALVVPRIASRPAEARITRAKQDLRTLESALDLYKLDNFRYPTTEQGLAALVEQPRTEPIPKNWKGDGYLARLPKDPWGNPYRYRSPGSEGLVDIFTFGADGEAGGTVEDQDIGNWNLE